MSSFLKDTLLDEVVVQTSYSAFFSECATRSCSYSITGRQNIIIIVTNLISILSGLSVAFRLVTPFLFYMAHWCLGHVQGRIDLFRTIRGLPHQLMYLNFFFNRRKSSDSTLRIEQRTTRLYIFLWLSVFSLLLLYNYFAEETIAKSVLQPTEKMYNALYAGHRTTLQCPCTNILFSQASYAQWSAELHQVCASPFIEDPWIRTVFGDGNWSNLATNQFRSRGVVYFIVQKALCDMGQRVTDAIVREFLSGEIFRGNVIPKDELITRITDSIESSIYKITNDFVSILRCQRGIIQVNRLMNIFSTGWIYSSRGNRNTPYTLIPTRPASYESNCSCAMSSACTTPVYIGDKIAPGFVLGCDPMESLLRSTLTCLYNQTCLQLINSGNASSIRSLDPTLSSRYRIDSTVEELSAAAFIEDWSLNISYSTYFSTCNPVICTYSISQRKEILQVITILLGLYGGLMLILRFVAPRLMAAPQRTSLLIGRRRGLVVSFA